MPQQVFKASKVRKMVAARRTFDELGVTVRELSPSHWRCTTKSNCIFDFWPTTYTAKVGNTYREFCQPSDVVVWANGAQPTSVAAPLRGVAVASVTEKALREAILAYRNATVSAIHATDGITSQHRIGVVNEKEAELDGIIKKIFSSKS